MRRILTLALIAAFLASPGHSQSRGGGDGFGATETSGRSLDAATVPGTRRTEFVAIAPTRQATAAANALTASGAQLLRNRPLGRLNRTLLVLDLRDLPPAQARQILSRAAPNTRLDVHSFYRYAAGPRLYAAALTQDQPGACRLKGTRIGVIDGPVDPAHPVLKGAAIRTGSALLPQDRPTRADHGTAVAALLAGVDPTGALTGFAPGAQVFAATAFAQEPRGPAADVERIGIALDWLSANGVALVNMSFAGPANDALAELLSAAAGRGMVMIAAAGNDGASTAAYPAAAPQVIAVTAVDAAGRRYRSANSGPQIEFAAPGVDLYVAQRNGGGYASGTSYAAPIVTAFAARLMARGTRSAQGIRSQMARTARDLGPKGRDTQYGMGLISAPDC